MPLTMKLLAPAVVAMSAICGYAGVANSAPDENADPIGRLKGYWKGDGTVILASGPDQPFKCIVTYRHSDDTGRLKQNLSCKNESYQLRAATLLHIDGETVTGSWEDKVNSLTGDVNGTVTDDGFDVNLRGRFFEAKMRVTGSSCEQSVTVTPKRKNVIRVLTASLRRC